MDDATGKVATLPYIEYKKKAIKLNAVFLKNANRDWKNLN